MYHIAQLNLARLKAPKGDPLTEEFFSALTPMNLLAEAQPGFVWRLVGDVTEHTAIDYFLDPYLVVNMSVWESLQHFRHFVYRSGHVQYIRRKVEWFENFDGPHTVLWWVRVGHVPDLSEALEKLELLRSYGPTPEAFDLRRAFEPNSPRIDR